MERKVAWYLLLCIPNLGMKISFLKSCVPELTGTFLKNTSPLKLFDAIQEVRKEGVPLSPEVAKKLLRFFWEDKKKSKERFGLTERESELLQLLVKGYSIKSIASKLNIAYDTSRSHLRNIYHKLHVTCGKEAIAKVLSCKIKL